MNSVDEDPRMSPEFGDREVVGAWIFFNQLVVDT